MRARVVVIVAASANCMACNQAISIAAEAESGSILASPESIPRAIVIARMKLETEAARLGWKHDRCSSCNEARELLS